MEGLASVCCWRVTMPDDDWYIVFARDASQAVDIVAREHYAMDGRTLYQTYTLRVERLANDYPFEMLMEDGELETNAAEDWARGEIPGPFASNTYEY